MSYALFVTLLGSAAVADTWCDIDSRESTARLEVIVRRLWLITTLVVMILALGCEPAAKDKKEEGKEKTEKQAEGR